MKIIFALATSIIGFHASLYSMESSTNKDIVAHIITYNGDTIDRITPINQEKLTILIENSETIANFIEDIGNTNLKKIHLRNMSYEDYSLIDKELQAYNSIVKKWHESHEIFCKVMCSKFSDTAFPRINKLIKCFKLADYLAIPSLIDGALYSMKEVYFWGLARIEAFNIPADLLELLRKDIDENFKCFQDKILKAKVENLNKNYFTNDCLLLNDKQKLLFIWLDKASPGWLKFTEANKIQRHFDNELNRDLLLIEKILNIHLGFTPRYFKKIIEKAYGIKLNNTLPTFSTLIGNASHLYNSSRLKKFSNYLNCPVLPNIKIHKNIENQELDDIQIINNNKKFQSINQKIKCNIL